MLLNKPFDWLGQVALRHCVNGEFVFVWFVRFDCFLVEGCEKQIGNF
jgi:hypothetical protein